MPHLGCTAHCLQGDVARCISGACNHASGATNRSAHSTACHLHALRCCLHGLVEQTSVAVGGIVQQHTDSKSRRQVQVADTIQARCVSTKAGWWTRVRATGCQHVGQPCENEELQPLACVPFAMASCTSCAASVPGPVGTCCACCACSLCLRSGRQSCKWVAGNSHSSNVMARLGAAAQV